MESSSTQLNLNLKLSNLPLRPSTLSTFLNRGFVTTAEIESSRTDGGMANLATELNVSLPEAASLYRELDTCIRTVTGTPSSSNELNPPSIAVTAASLLFRQNQRQTRPIVTFCRSIDDLLGGGFAISEITELVGIPGAGKTQIAMQACVDARLPIPYGGVAGEAVYVDTEGSFAPERCWTMAEALVRHVQNSAVRRKAVVPDWFSSERVLEGIHVYRVHDEAAQMATIMALPEFLKGRAEGGCPVKIVVVDSVAFHYRSMTNNTDYINRTRSLATIASFLSDLAANFELAVVVVNQMTTKIEGNKTSSSSSSSSFDEFKLIPALGESWAHATTTRLLLSSENDVVRRCTLVKSPHKPAGVAFYTVKEVGVRDLSPEEELMVKQQQQQQKELYRCDLGGDAVEDVAKRQRINY